MKKAFYTGLLFIFVSALALAEEAGHEGIPYGKIGIQALNLGILLAALIYLTRKSIIGIFVQRRETFNEQSQKTASAIKLAEAELKDIKSKLATLESTEAQSIQKAKTEAENVKINIVQEASRQAEKIKSDVALIISAELYKAKTEIRNQIIEKSMAAAKETVRGSAQSITQKSEKGFVADLGQVKT
jgi:F0F1-type ATP synthase membrane subunit b/b'